MGKLSVLKEMLLETAEQTVEEGSLEAGVSEARRGCRGSDRERPVTRRGDHARGVLRALRALLRA
jgi:hypothetical protein